MLASLYICSQSFMYNGGDTQKEVCSKVAQFTQLHQYIWDNFSADNTFYVNTEHLGQSLIYKGITLLDILCHKVDFLPKELLLSFLSVFNKSTKTQVFSNADLCEYLSLESAEECQGIVVINQQKDIPSCYQVFSTIQGWRNFRRYFLSKYPKSSEFFIQEAKKYFPQLQFSENICSKLNDVLNSHCRKIVAGLSILNDYCYSDWSCYSGDAISFIEHFAKTHDSEGSFEGTKKAALKAKFKRKHPEEEFECYCEPHLKYNEDDYGNTRQYMRIYFQHPNASPDGYIYVGFIIKHID